MKKLVDEIITFVRDNGYFNKTSDNTLRKILETHYAYGTIMVLRDEKGIASIARWNWRSVIVIEILDCLVRKDLRHKNLVKKMLVIGLTLNPDCQYIIWQRNGNKRTRKMIDAKKLITKYKYLLEEK